mgnify:CR=1 FL=1
MNKKKEEKKRIKKVNLLSQILDFKMNTLGQFQIISA